VTGLQLKTRRIEVGLNTQRELAEETQVSLKAVKFWEQNRNPIPKWLPNYLDLYEQVYCCH